MQTDVDGHHEAMASLPRSEAGPRFPARELLPDLFAGLVRASRHPDGPLPAATLELVKLRASQINGCAFCCDLHGRRAAAAGVDELILRALPGWRDLTALSETERAALDVAEAITRLDAGHGLEKVLDNGQQVLGEGGLAQTVASVAAVSAWNRVMVSSGAAPDPSYA